MLQAEPAAAARWLYAIIAGDESSPPRRILAGTAVALCVVVATVVFLASILGSFTLIGRALDRLAPAGRGSSGVETSWLLITFTTGAFVGVATVVTWSGRRRQRHRADAGEGGVGGNGAGRGLRTDDAGARSTQ